MLFVRDQEGIYTYGKKKIFMKIEKESIIVRVGGGYLTLDEFIETYSPYEVRKRQKQQFSSMLNVNT